VEVEGLKKILMLAVIFGLAAGLAGCGYGLIGRTSTLPEDLKTIYVEPLQNRTTRPQIELTMTRAIINELVTRRRFTIATNRESADAVLSGTLTSFTVRPVTFDPQGRADEWQIAIRADMSFTRNDTDEVVWEQPLYNFSDNYELDLEEGTVFDPEDRTIQIVSVDFAQTLVIDLLEGF
jgi:outer membrane lipopolysaccharide assembly protein LptE/RlpB